MVSAGVGAEHSGRSQKQARFRSIKVIVACAAQGGIRDSARMRVMDPRLKQIEAMLNGARERVEQAPSLSEVLDHLLAPLYFRALIWRSRRWYYAAGLVDHLLRSYRE
jgi:hypothetical protein